MNLLADMQSIWDVVTSPMFIIIYIAALVLLMISVIVTVMVNEYRFSAFVKRLESGEDKSDGEKESRGSRFDMLTRLDAELPARTPTAFADDVSLAEFCDMFRNFAAGQLHLFYDIGIIREFVAGLAVSHILILQGMSGTGKTSLAFAFGEFVSNPSTVIPVQPMWKDRSDLLGYYNEFTKRFNETQLLQKMYEANGRADMFITILDEMNIARVEYYFAEFLSLLEIPDPQSRFLDVVSDHWQDDPKGIKNGRIRLPDNMWFLGTANNDDSTFAISDKVYDRAMIINIDSKSEPFIAPACRPLPVSARRFVELADKAVGEHPVTQTTFENLRKIDKYLADNYHISFGNRIMKQIMAYVPVYVACGGEELDALDDILAKKVLRKLATQNMTYRKAGLETLCDTFNEYFGAERMTRCLETIRRLARNG